MLNYILRRLLLIPVTLFGIMLLNFVIIQFAPGGPVEQVIAQLQGTDVSSTARITNQGATAVGHPHPGRGTISPRPPATVALRGLIPKSSNSSKFSSVLTNRPMNGSG